MAAREINVSMPCCGKSMDWTLPEEKTPTTVTAIVGATQQCIHCGKIITIHAIVHVKVEPE